MLLGTKTNIWWSIFLNMWSTWSIYIKNQLLNIYINNQLLSCCYEDAHPSPRMFWLSAISCSLYIYVFNLHHWTWSAARSYISLPGKLLLLSSIRFPRIKIQYYLLSFPQNITCQINHTMMWHFTMWIFLPWLSLHSLHLGLQLPINTILLYSKVFFFILWIRNKTKIKHSASLIWMIF